VAPTGASPAHPWCALLTVLAHWLVLQACAHWRAMMSLAHWRVVLFSLTKLYDASCCHAPPRRAMMILGTWGGEGDDGCVCLSWLMRGLAPQRLAIAPRDPSDPCPGAVSCPQPPAGLLACLTRREATITLSAANRQAGLWQTHWEDDGNDEVLLTACCLCFSACARPDGLCKARTARLKRPALHPN